MRWTKLLVLGAVSAACGNSTPTNFAGTYNVTLVDGANDCNISGWTPGTANPNITATITQDGAFAQLSVPSGTATGFLLVLFLGTNSFPGDVEGDQFTTNYLGTKQQTVNGTNCTYNVRAQLSLTLAADDSVSGSLTYVPVTNGDASCGVLNACSNSQSVVGSRTGP